MKFIDEAIITLSAGHGGKGSIHFRREKFIPRGGPDGGDGGKGGDIYLVSEENIATLQTFRYKRAFKAPHGEQGSGKNCSGKDGEDILLKVPVGTIVKDTETGEILHDFTKNEEVWQAVKGGRGGKGNAHFVTSTFQAPKFAQPGEEGDVKKFALELKLIADAGIIGFPNAGKSTFISRISAARPKVADYAFTTLTPNLGVVTTDDYKSFVVADIPGLVEGAHKGRGLGHKFLKHIERTRVFIHMIDGVPILEKASSPEIKNPIAQAVKEALAAYTIIRRELELFDEKLIHKPEILVINKLDLISSDKTLLKKLKDAFRKELPKARRGELHPKEPFFISAASGEGVNELKHMIFAEIEAQKVSQGKGGKKKLLLPHEIKREK